MSENQKKILQMLSEGKISVDEAQRLLTLIDAEGARENGSVNMQHKYKTVPRYMHVIVEPKPGTVKVEGRDFHGKVNVRVPFGLIRAGMKFATLIPSDAAEHVDRAFKEKGLNFDIRRLKDEDLDELITALHDSEINVDSDHETIRVYAE